MKYKKFLKLVFILLINLLIITSSIQANIRNKQELTTSSNTIWVGVEFTFEYTYTDPEEDVWFFQIDWGDGSNSEWQGPFNSGETICNIHYWENPGNYEIKFRLKDKFGYESEWSDPIPITVIKPNRLFYDMKITGCLQFKAKRGLIISVIDFYKAEITEAKTNKEELEPFVCHNYKFLTLFLNVKYYYQENLNISAFAPFSILISYR